MTKARLHKCKKCGFKGGPTSMSKHYKNNLSHRPPSLAARHQTHGTPKSWTKKRKRRASYKRAVREQADKGQAVRDPKQAVPAKSLDLTGPYRSEVRMVFCWNCGTRLSRGI